MISNKQNSHFPPISGFRSSYLASHQWARGNHQNFTTLYFQCRLIWKWDSQWTPCELLVGWTSSRSKCWIYTLERQMSAHPWKSSAIFQWWGEELHASSGFFSGLDEQNDTCPPKLSGHFTLHRRIFGVVLRQRWVEVDIHLRSCTSWLFDRAKGLMEVLPVRV